jgi:hypothetical protein
MAKYEPRMVRSTLSFDGMRDPNLVCTVINIQATYIAILEAFLAKKFGDELTDFLDGLGMVPPDQK